MVIFVIILQVFSYTLVLYFVGIDGKLDVCFKIGVISEREKKRAKNKARVRKR